MVKFFINGTSKVLGQFSSADVSEYELIDLRLHRIVTCEKCDISTEVATSKMLLMMTKCFPKIKINKPCICE